MRPADIPDASEVKSDAAADLLFYTQVCDEKYFASQFHAFLADKLQSVADGKIKRLILNTPPQHGKSRLCSIEFPTWLLGRDPSKRVAIASYAQALATRNSRESRARMMSSEYQSLFDTRLDETNQAVENWGVVGGGGYRAVGIGGSLTGHSVDVLIIDDPLKDHAEANSPAYRDNVWEWFLSVAYTRLSPNGVIIVIMTRWHVDDLVGRLLNQERRKELQAASGGAVEDWTMINLPALAHDDDIMGRKEGAALYPERYNAAHLAGIKATIGDYLWSALYDGNPVRKGGNYVAIDKFRIIDAENVPEGLSWRRFWDLAATEKETSDFTAGAKCAKDMAGNFYIADITAGQWEWPKARGTIATIAQSERILVGIEVVGGFRTSFANLREVLPPSIMLRDYGVDKDKLTRALPWIGLVDAGKVFLVRGPWNLPFMQQAAAFPNADHDDMVDAVSGGYAMVFAPKIMVA